jgi:GNAT superfamily N-acetyltransferase
VHSIMKVLIMTVVFLSGNVIYAMNIRSIQADQITETKQMITKVCFEVWEPNQTLDEFTQTLEKECALYDLENTQEVYFNNKGTFLVLLDGEKVVGAGAIKYFTDDICELKRMWFLQEYRGKGYGLKMAEQLLKFAKDVGYRIVCLDVYQPEKQERAVEFYKKLGFREIPAYLESPAKLFMEKSL